MAHFPGYVRVCVRVRNPVYSDEDFEIVGIVREEERDGSVCVSEIEEHIGAFRSRTPDEQYAGFLWSRELVPVIHLHSHATRVMKVIDKAIAHAQLLKNIGLDVKRLRPGEEVWSERV